ncbi:transposase [Brucella cytisi]|uniref:transposase n=1 Tax=Brucella cytisi TaxID=407152 RepID=UPI001F3F403F|nr:transposase [Brucella cytisi]
MADENNTNVSENATETKVVKTAVAKPKVRATRKKSDTKSAKSAAASVAKSSGPASKTVSVQKAASKTEPATRTVKRYTPAQRASLLAAVEKATSSGSTLKTALQKLEVSEQTYYNWKNATGKAKPAAAKGSPVNDLQALINLEAENLALRKELANKLRTENAELRKRLGKA